jgi:hypothetical protein
MLSVRASAFVTALNGLACLLLLGLLANLAKLALGQAKLIWNSDQPKDFLPLQKQRKTQVASVKSPPGPIARRRKTKT